MTKTTSTNEKLAELIDTLEKAWATAMDLNTDDDRYDEFREYEKTLYALLNKVNDRAVRRLAYNGGLIGTEYCNECAEVIGTVTKVDCSDLSPMVVYDRPPGSEYSSGGEYLG